MNFLPFEKFTIETRLSQEEIQEKLATIIGDVEYIADPFAVEIPYYGEFDKDHFKMWRVRTLVKNDFAPVIEGTITPGVSSTSIDVTMRFKYSTMAVFVFMFIFCLLLGLIKIEIVFPFSGMFFVFYIISILVFNYGTNQAKSRFDNLFSPR